MGLHNNTCNQKRAQFFEKTIVAVLFFRIVQHIYFYIKNTKHLNNLISLKMCQMCQLSLHIEFQLPITVLSSILVSDDAVI